MARRLISSGSSFERTAGYSRAVVDGDWVFVSGTTGMDYKAMTIEPDVIAQTRQTLKNIGVALTEAGSSFAEVVRVHYYFTDAADWRKVAPVLGEVFGDTRPAATAIVCALIDPRMKIEIEVTARKKG
jgi:enamine deaminase RidA (YjgF/YER057c/UK114 family)